MTGLHPAHGQEAVNIGGEEGQHRAVVTSANAPSQSLWAEIHALIYWDWRQVSCHLLRVLAGRRNGTMAPTHVQTTAPSTGWPSR